MILVIHYLARLLNLYIMAWWIIVLLLLLFFICWILISPVEVEIDSRIPHAKLQWFGIGRASLWYDDEWRLSMYILFFRKTIRLSEIKKKPQKKRAEPRTKKPKKRKYIRTLLTKTVRIIKTFRVTDWQLAIDTGDQTCNAQLYPLNFLPGTFRHLHINFSTESYLLLKIRNRPWKMVYEFLR